jgi:hypothetical protein
VQTVDDRRPIRRELIEPGNLGQLHNKWTFPTALLYVLTVLTTCGWFRFLLTGRPLTYLSPFFVCGSLID